MAPTVSQGPGTRPRRRGHWQLLLVVLLLVVPLLEVVVIIAVGRAIGGWQTFFLLLAESMFGAWLVRREGARAWASLQEALTTGTMPSRQLSDAALVMVGGVLLLAPGFITDFVGFFLVLPFTRPLARRLLEAVPARKVPDRGPTRRRAAPPPTTSSRAKSSNRPSPRRSSGSVDDGRPQRDRHRPRSPTPGRAPSTGRGPSISYARQAVRLLVGFSPRDSRSRVRRSSSSSSSSGIERRSRSMSQWVRTCLVSLGVTSGPSRSLASLPQRHSHTGGTSASTLNGSSMRCPCGHT